MQKRDCRIGFSAPLSHPGGAVVYVSLLVALLVRFYSATAANEDALAGIDRIIK